MSVTEMINPSLSIPPDLAAQWQALALKKGVPVKDLVAQRKLLHRQGKGQPAAAKATADKGTGQEQVKAEVLRAFAASRDANSFGQDETRAATRLVTGTSSAAAAAGSQLSAKTLSYVSTASTGAVPVLPPPSTAAPSNSDLQNILRKFKLMDFFKDGVFNWKAFVVYIGQKRTEHFSDVQVAEQGISQLTNNADMESQLADEVLTKDEVAMDRGMALLSFESDMIDTRKSFVNKLVNDLAQSKSVPNIEHLNPQTAPKIHTRSLHDHLRASNLDIVGGRQDGLRRDGPAANETVDAKKERQSAEAIKYAEWKKSKWPNNLIAKDEKSYTLTADELDAFAKHKDLVINRLKVGAKSDEPSHQRSLLSESEIQAMKNTGDAHILNFVKRYEADHRGRFFNTRTGHIPGKLAMLRYERKLLLAIAQKAHAQAENPHVSAQEQQDYKTQAQRATTAANDFNNEIRGHETNLRWIMQQVGPSSTALGGLMEQMGPLYEAIKEIEEKLERTEVDIHEPGSEYNKDPGKRLWLKGLKRDMQQQAEILQEMLAPYRGGNPLGNPFVQNNRAQDVADAVAAGTQKPEKIDGRTRRFKSGDAQMKYDAIVEQIEKGAVQGTDQPDSATWREHNRSRDEQLQKGERGKKQLELFNKYSPPFQAEACALSRLYHQHSDLEDIDRKLANMVDVTSPGQKSARDELVQRRQALLRAGVNPGQRDSDINALMRRSPHVTKTRMVNHAHDSRVHRSLTLARAGKADDTSDEALKTERAFWERRTYAQQESRVPAYLRPALNPGKVKSNMPPTTRDANAQRQAAGVPEAADPQDTVDYLNPQSVANHLEDVSSAGDAAFNGLRFREYAKLQIIDNGIRTASNAFQSISANTSAPVHQILNTSSGLAGEIAAQLERECVSLGQFVFSLQNRLNSMVQKPSTF